MSQYAHLSEISETDFEKEVSVSDIPVLADFFTPPCAPCKALVPVLEKLAGKYPNIKIVKINAWNNPNLCKQFKIVGVPALLFFRNGENVLRVDGLDVSNEKRIEDAIIEVTGN